MRKILGNIRCSRKTRREKDVGRISNSFNPFRFSHVPRLEGLYSLYEIVQPSFTTTFVSLPEKKISHFCSCFYIRKAKLTYRMCICGCTKKSVFCLYRRDSRLKYEKENAKLEESDTNANRFVRSLGEKVVFFLHYCDIFLLRFYKQLSPRLTVQKKRLKESFRKLASLRSNKFHWR